MASPAVAALRATINRANSQHSTGPRTQPGKNRSSQNALTHGLSAHSALLPSEGPAAYEEHCRRFHDEFQPATASETQLVTELASTAWRLNRIPILEAELLNRAANPPNEQARIDFDIVDCNQALVRLGLHSTRLSRQYQKTLVLLREIQAERCDRERRQLRDAAGILEFHKRKGLTWDPSDDGFVFSKEQIECHARFLIHRNEARTIDYVCFDMTPKAPPSPNSY